MTRNCSIVTPSFPGVADSAPETRTEGKEEHEYKPNSAADAPGNADHDDSDSQQPVEAAEESWVSPESPDPADTADAEGGPADPGAGGNGSTEENRQEGEPGTEETDAGYGSRGGAGETETESKQETVTEPESQPETESGPGSELESESGSELESESETETESETESETELESESETGTELESESETELESESELVNQNTESGILTDTFLSDLIVVRREPVIDNDGDVKDLKYRGMYFFVHSERLRNSYDTWSVVDALSSSGFQEANSSGDRDVIIKVQQQPRKK